MSDRSTLLARSRRHHAEWNRPYKTGRHIRQASGRLELEGGLGAGATGPGRQAGHGLTGSKTGHSLPGTEPALCGRRIDECPEESEIPACWVAWVVWRS